MRHPLPPELRLAWDSSPALVLVTRGTDHVLSFQNAESVRLFGRRTLGLPMNEAFPELAGRPMQTLDSVLQNGEVVQVPRADTGVRDVNGDAVHLRYVLAPLGVAHPYDGVVITSVDVTAETDAARAVERAELLSRLAERMSSATDPDAALRALTDQLVPAVCDVAAVYVVPDLRVSSARGPTAMTISVDLLATAGPPPIAESGGGPSPWEAALAAGKTVVVDVQDGPAIGDAKTVRWMQAAMARTLVVVPLAVAGELTGALVLLTTVDRPPLTDADVAVLEDAAARAGTAVANARAYQQQRQVALNLQRSLLPAAPPTPPGSPWWRATSPAVTRSRWVATGGTCTTWAPEGSASAWATCPAAACPPRSSWGRPAPGMRAAAHADLPPADLLTVLDAQVHELVAVESADDSALRPRFATAAYAVIETFDQTLRIANAGHPPLLVRDPAGVVRRVSAPPGPPLGLGIGGYEEAVTEFPAGSLLLAFTDGLVESSTVDIDEGIDRLAADLEAVGPGPRSRRGRRPDAAPGARRRRRGARAVAQRPVGAPGGAGVGDPRAAAGRAAGTPPAHRSGRRARTRPR